MTEVNPFTGKKISVDGATYKLVKQIQSQGGTFAQQQKAYLSAKHQTTKSAYSNVPADKFCGPSGGAPANTYPVDSEKRCRAALSYARNAPDPKGIRDCALKLAKENNWNCGKYSHPNKHKKVVGKPKRPLTGYHLFNKGQLPKLKAQGIKGKDAIVASAQAWKALSDKQKADYKAKAQAMKPIKEQTGGCCGKKRRTHAK